MKGFFCSILTLISAVNCTLQASNNPNYHANYAEAKQTHNFSQDWSLQNLTTTNSVNPNIALYGQLSPTSALVKISGNEP